MFEKKKKQLLTYFNEQAPIAKHFGMRLSYSDTNRAIVDLPYNPALNHAMGGIHGGVYATLLDTAGWFTSAVTHEESIWIATSELSMHFLKPAQECSLQAIGKIIQSGKRQDIVEMHIYDGNEQLVGHGTGTFILLPTILMGVEKLIAKNS